jgi:hypothetical protein
LGICFDRLENCLLQILFNSLEEEEIKSVNLTKMKNQRGVTITAALIMIWLSVILLNRSVFLQLAGVCIIVVRIQME